MAKRRNTHRKPKTTDKPGLPKHESKLSTNIPEDVHRKLKAVAALRGISIRELLIEYADSLVLETPKSGRRSLCFEGRFPEITKIPPGTPPTSRVVGTRHPRSFTRGEDRVQRVTSPPARKSPNRSSSRARGQVDSTDWETEFAENATRCFGKF